MKNLIYDRNMTMNVLEVISDEYLALLKILKKKYIRGGLA